MYYIGQKLTNVHKLMCLLSMLYDKCMIIFNKHMQNLKLMQQLRIQFYDYMYYV